MLHLANKYTSHEIQNDIIKVMAMHVLRDVTARLQQSPFLTLMMDETTDVANKEQATILLFNEYLSIWNFTRNSFGYTMSLP